MQLLQASQAQCVVLDNALRGAKADKAELSATCSQLQVRRWSQKTKT